MSESSSDTPDEIQTTNSVSIVNPETWIYFSQSTFVNSDFLQGMKTPNVKRQLNGDERKLLDSVVAGFYNPPPDTNPQPKVGCYWPKHAIKIISQNATSAINICFECNSSRSSDGGLNKVPMKAWEVFFQRIGIPVRTGYADFFARARTDSTFRDQNGIFQF